MPSVWPTRTEPNSTAYNAKAFSSNALQLNFPQPTSPVLRDKPVNLAEAVAASLGAPELLSLPAQVPCLAADLYRSQPAQACSRPQYRAALPGFQLSTCCLVHSAQILGG